MRSSVSTLRMREQKSFKTLKINYFIPSHSHVGLLSFGILN
jgi:hypothetical protein